MRKGFKNEKSEVREPTVNRTLKETSHAARGWERAQGHSERSKNAQPKVRDSTTRSAVDFVSKGASPALLRVKVTRVVCFDVYAFKAV
jgi:hypothetical protein